MSNLKIGDKAPEFLVKISEDKEYSLEELKGKYVVLYFYPKDNTPGCTLEAMDFNELLQDFQVLNTMVLGVSRDNLKSHSKFKDKYNLKFNLGSDVEGETCSKYGVWVEKSMFGKKYMGVNRATFLINTQGKIAHIWTKVSVEGHAREVLNKIRDLSA
ncbi:MAG: thioredoxin-dependent thiol peroxidase [Rickettsiaceae bacterium]